MMLTRRYFLSIVTTIVAVSIFIPSSIRAETLGQPISIEDPSGHALDELHRALRLAEKGKGRARLTFYGDSHTSEDLYTGYLRSRLQQRFGDGGPGLVMPVHPFPCHGYRDVLVTHFGPWKTIRVKGRHRPRDAYGLAGYAIESSKSAWGRIELVNTKGRGSKVSHVDLFHLLQPRGGRVEVIIDGAKAQQFSTQATSVQSGVKRIERSGRLFEFRALGDGPVRLFGASLERSTTGVIVDAFGIPGSKGRDQLVWDTNVQRAQLDRIAPDLLVLEYGTNESGGDLQGMPRYEQDLRAVVKRLRAVRPNTSCLLMGPSEWPERRPNGSYRPRTRTVGIIEVQRRVARDMGCAFFDTLAFMGGPGSMVRWTAHDPPLALSDHVHFTDEGHRRLASALESALLEGLDSTR